MAEIIARGVRFHVQQLAPCHRPHQPEPPVVFIHGLGMDNLSSFYYTLANPVARAGARVILYDLRGHGLSERPSTGYRVNDSVADLAAILDTLGVDGPVHLVGNSYGGIVALSFAAAYPARVASMVLIEAHFSIAGWAEQIMAERTRLEPALVGGALRLDLLGRKVVRLTEMADDLLNRTTFLADLQAVAPIPMSRQLNEYLPHCVLTVLDDCGHSVLMDATERLREIVLDWFVTQASVNAR
jgi:pimeloyl-ACP methyl ester carboxylesterase